MAHQTFIDLVFKDKAGKISVLQFPNLPLIVWVVGTLLARISDGLVQDVSSFLALIALVIWASLEVKTGESLLRKILGGAVLVALILNRL